MIQGNTVTLHLDEVTKGRTAMLVKVKPLEAISRPKLCCWFHQWPQKAIIMTGHRKSSLGPKFGKQLLVLTTWLARAQRDSLQYTQNLKWELHYSSNFNLQYLPPPKNLLDKDRGIWTLHQPCTVEREAVPHLSGVQTSLQVRFQTSHHNRALHTTGLINLTCTFPTTTRGGGAPRPSSLSQVLLSSHGSFPSSVPGDCPD